MPNDQQNEGKEKIDASIDKPRQIVGFSAFSLLVHSLLVVPSRPVLPLGRAGSEGQKEGVSRVSKNVKTTAPRGEAETAKGQEEAGAQESPVGVVSDIGRSVVAAANEPKGNEENEPEGSRDDDLRQQSFFMLWI